MTVRFTDLFDDIILKIAHECTAYEVLALERTCKTLRDFFSHSNRQLWLRLLGDLDDFHAPDLPSRIAIDSLSFKELKRLVTRAVDGYTNWKTYSPSGPRITRRQVINLKNKGSLLGDLESSDFEREIIKIIPGGRYLFLLWSEGYLQCWDVEKNDAIWTYPQLGAFQQYRVAAYDVEYDARSGLLFVAIVEGNVEWEGQNSSYRVRAFWLNPETKHASLYTENQKSFHRKLPSLLRICEDAIITLNVTNIVIMSRSLRKSLTLVLADVIRDTVHVSDGHLLFIGKTSLSNRHTLFALNVQHICMDSRLQGVTMFSGELSTLVSIESERLRHLVLQVPLSNPSTLSGLGLLESVRLMTCKPTWREAESGASTMVYVIGKLINSPSKDVQPLSSHFCLYTFQFSASSSILPPSLTLVQALPPISIPLSHPYCREEVHALSHAGRGILASVNIMHKGARYYAFSLEEFFEGHVRRSFGPISFGNDRVAPGEVYMEKYSGALAFVTKDQKSLVIQCYD